MMQKHTMALGYFFLAIFCIFTSAQESLRMFSPPLLVAAFAAAMMGLGFLLSAVAPLFAAVKDWFIRLMRLAQQPPVEHKPLSAEG
ncbi:MAG: hypothetical protein KF777_06685 [Planctomycetaceae bacterium]|nr:hypothetical protein [Planctomycetaceae bacterium]